MISFLIGLWTSTITFLTIYSFLFKDDGSILLCFILLLFTYFGTGYYFGEKVYIEKLKKGDEFF